MESRSFLNQLREQQRIERRHLDTLCCSIMTLITIAMGGLFAFVRTSLTGSRIDGIWSLGASEITTIGTLVALMLYVTGVWRGMRVLTNQSGVGKEQTFRRFRAHCILIVIVIAITVAAGTITTTQPDQNQMPLGSSGGGLPGSGIPKQ